MAPSNSTYAMSDVGLDAAVTIVRILFALSGVALYNSLELVILVFATFKRYNSLYFWSIFLSTVAIIPYTLGLLFKFFGVIPIDLISVTFVVIGWHFMVTGQSVVMYSRLHLVSSNQLLSRGVLLMIIINWFIGNVPTTVFAYAVNSRNPGPYMHVYGVWERLQLCLYFVQEALISGLYIFQIVKRLKHEQRPGTQASRQSPWRKSSRNVMMHLIYVNVIIIFLDITLLVIEFVGHYEIQVLYKVSTRSC